MSSSSAHIVHARADNVVFDMSPGRMRIATGQLQAEPQIIAISCSNCTSMRAEIAVKEATIERLVASIELRDDAARKLSEQYNDLVWADGVERSIKAAQAAGIKLADNAHSD